MQAAPRYPVAVLDSQPPAIDTASTARHRYRLTIAYDGSAYHGWQKQKPPPDAQADADDVETQPLPTVAGTLEPILARLLRQPITLVGASRTDAGVHALGQVAHFDAADVRVPVERLAEAINSRLPADIEVRHAARTHNDFHATRDALCKQYRYRVWNASHRPLTLRHTVYHCWSPLDVERMNNAARRLVGTHDFEGLAAAGHGRQSTVRTIFDCRVEARPVESVSDRGIEMTASPSPGRVVDIVVQGDGFLYNMVRILAGTLVEVGRGRFQPARIDDILAAADRRLAGPTLPPQGLCLEWIRYPEITLDPRP
jgi:tRNA pseudouridine38-40 synthase